MGVQASVLLVAIKKEKKTHTHKHTKHTLNEWYYSLQNCK